ncbi:hypothetical protein ACQKIE_10085 [Luteibacter sp. NPDC031894]|uniref:hypothetical protein n=1 Tax=Luteibacter sp. NPDC031894 TaxID=3390572 RepID=UPI003D069BC9
MLVSVQDVRRCLEQVVEVRDHYRQNVLNGDAVRKSIDQLRWIIETYLQKVVKVEDVEWKAKTIAAMALAIRDGSYEIYILQGLSDDARRFAYCKELFHVVIDEVEARTMSIYAHLEEVLATFPVDDSQPRKSTVSERLAEAAAMEFLFPYTDRLHFIGTAKDGVLDFEGCGAKRGVPPHLIELYCSDSYMDFFGKF